MRNGKMDKSEAKMVRELLNVDRWKALADASVAGVPANTVLHIQSRLNKLCPEFSFGFFTEWDLVRKGLRQEGWEPITKAHMREIDPNKEFTPTVMEQLGMRWNEFGVLTVEEVIVCIRPKEISNSVLKRKVEATNDRFSRSINMKRGEIGQMHPGTKPELEFDLNVEFPKKEE